MSQFPGKITCSTQMRSQTFKKGEESKDDPIRRYLKHFLCQDDADILELGLGFKIKDISDSVIP